MSAAALSAVALSAVALSAAALSAIVLSAAALASDIILSAAVLAALAIKLSSYAASSAADDASDIILAFSISNALSAAGSTAPKTVVSIPVLAFAVSVCAFIKACINSAVDLVLASILTNGPKASRFFSAKVWVPVTEVIVSAIIFCTPSRS